jgi:HSP20 family protein
MANIRKYDPFTDVDDFFRGFFLRPVRMGAGDETSGLDRIKVDISEDDKNYKVHAEVPGVKKEDIKVSIDGNIVSITAESKRQSDQKDGDKVVRSERYYGTMTRAFALDSEVDENRCEAKYQDGVLELVLPKKEGARSRQITIQ